MASLVEIKLLWSRLKISWLQKILLVTKAVFDYSYANNEEYDKKKMKLLRILCWKTSYIFFKKKKKNFIYLIWETNLDKNNVKQSIKYCP